MKPDTQNQQLSSTHKKTYIRPALTTYGSVTEMTHNVTLTGTGDGGHAGATKHS